MLDTLACPARQGAVKTAHAPQRGNGADLHVVSWVRPSAGFLGTVSEGVRHQYGMAVSGSVLDRGRVAAGDFKTSWQLDPP